MDIEKADSEKAQRQIEFDNARKDIIEALKTISVESEWLFQFMPKDREAIEFIESAKSMTERIAQRYGGVLRYIKDKNPELESEFVQKMNQTLEDFCGIGLQLSRKPHLRKSSDLLSRDSFCLT